MDMTKTTPDRQRAASLLDTAGLRLDLVTLMKNSDIVKYSSKIAEEYYEVVLELITALMSIDGYKTRADLSGSHITAIEYLGSVYKDFTGKEMALIDDLRKRRNGIKYYGKHVGQSYITMYENNITQLIEKLIKTARAKLA